MQELAGLSHSLLSPLLPRFDVDQVTLRPAWGAFGATLLQCCAPVQNQHKHLIVALRKFDQNAELRQGRV